jgi:2-polyprenyl-3-methyl-5-hydroxy-6-metoxy-1,4-benzoquinol methylase
MAVSTIPVRKNIKVKTASELHSNVPPDWYFRSLKENLFQNYWHNRRFSEVTKLSDNVKGKILDIGSADGVFTNKILEKTHANSIVGMDVLKSSVDWANHHWQRNKKMKFIVGDAHHLPFKPKTFDAVFALEVMEHVYHPQKVLAEIKRVLKKGGYAVLLVPTDTLIFRLGWDYVWTRTRGKIWDDTHIQTFRNDLLVKMVQDAGFKVEDSKKFILGMLQAVKVRKIN